MKRFNRLFAVAVLLLAVTAAGPVPAAAGPSPDPLTRSEVRGVKKFIGLRYRQAVREFDGGKIDRAEDILRAIQVLYPDNPWHKQVRKLRRRCEQRRIHREILAGDGRADKPFYTCGDSVAITFRLRNVGNFPLRIPEQVTTNKRFLLPDEVTPNNRMYIRYTQQEYYAAANMASVERTQFLTFDKEINLEPGETWEKTFTFRTGPHIASQGLLVTIRVLGTFVPLFVQEDTGVRHYPRFLFKPVTVTLLPAGWEKFVDKDNPLASLQKGLVEKQPLSVFYASTLIGPPQTGAALRLLMAALQNEPGLTAQSTAVMAALTQVTGLNYLGERALWNQWWRTAQETYFPKGSQPRDTGTTG